MPPHPQMGRGTACGGGGPERIVVRGVSFGVPYPPLRGYFPVATGKLSVPPRRSGEGDRLRGWGTYTYRRARRFVRSALSPASRVLPHLRMGKLFTTAIRSPESNKSRHSSRATAPSRRRDQPARILWMPARRCRRPASRGRRCVKGFAPQFLIPNSSFLIPRHTRQSPRAGAASAPLRANHSQYSRYSSFTYPSISAVWTATQPSSSGWEDTIRRRPLARRSTTRAAVVGCSRTFSAEAVTAA